MALKKKLPLVIAAFLITVCCSKQTNDETQVLIYIKNIVLDRVENNVFEAVNASANICFSDVDGDNDQDVIISGLNNERKPATNLYINDGKGNYTLSSANYFSDSYYGSVVFLDIDNDKDQDVIVTGINNTDVIDTEIYINDGNGNFTRQYDSEIEDIKLGAIAFADIDNDLDMDLVIAGINKSFKSITKLYKNDGVGNFTEVLDHPFENVSSSTLNFSDIDNDNDQDLFITGLNNENKTISKLYKNDGFGNFSEVLNTPFIGVTNASCVIFDKDNDNDLDILLAGYNTTERNVIKLYENKMEAGFIEVASSPFTPLENSSIAVTDIDSDGDIDVIISGVNGPESTTLYVNDGMGLFNKADKVFLVGVSSGAIGISDIDGDKDQDILVTGRTGFSETDPNALIDLYINNTEDVVLEE